MYQNPQQIKLIELLNMIATLQPMYQKNKLRKSLFEDADYAWKLLQSQMTIQLGAQIQGNDISTLLQLYMRGVERMNTVMDPRELFFKSRVTGLMSKPTVVKILNKPPMKKKKKKIDTVDAMSVKKVEMVTPQRQKKEIELQGKKKQLQMRLAYGTEESSPETVKKMLADQGMKQKKLQEKIDKIIDSHDRRLMQRIEERRMKTMTAKSRSQIETREELNKNSQGFGENSKVNTERESFEFQRDEKEFGRILEVHQQKEKSRKQHKSLHSHKTQSFAETRNENRPRKSSMDISEFYPNK